MSDRQTQEKNLEKEFLQYEHTSQNMSVITFSYEAYQQQKQVVETSRTSLLRNLDALKQTARDTREWNELLKKTQEALTEYKENVKLLTK